MRASIEIEDREPYVSNTSKQHAPKFDPNRVSADIMRRRVPTNGTKPLQESEMHVDPNVNIFKE